MIQDTDKCAIELFKSMYETKKRKFDAFDSMPDPQVEWVWLVIAKRETRKTIELLAAIVYIKAGDAEEVSALEALEKMMYSLDDAQHWIEFGNKRKVIDLGA